MKIRFLYYLLCSFILLITFNGCSDDRSKNSIEEKIHKSDNEVISQTVQSIVDSLDNLIKINLKEDYLKFKFINVYDSLYDVNLDGILE